MDQSFMDISGEKYTWSNIVTDHSSGGLTSDRDHVAAEDLMLAICWVQITQPKRFFM
jgi:hypothetical protein